MKRKNLRLKIAFRAVMLVLMLCGVGITKVFAAYDFSAVSPNGQTLYYQIVGNDVRVIYPFSSSIPYYGVTAPSGNLVIPTSVTHNGTTYNVTSIAPYALSQCTGLTTVTISNTITSIGQYAFYGDTALSEVTIGTDVTSIAFYSFWDCPSLTTVHFNATNCTQMHSDNQGSVFNSGSNYGGTSSIVTVTIGNNVTNIPDYAFYGCVSLSEITISENVNNIGNYAFWNCPSLTTVHFNATNCTQMHTQNGNVYSSVFNSGTTTSTNPAITTLTIGNNVTQIPNHAFRNSSYLTSNITIPNATTYIGTYAFYGCALSPQLTLGNSVTSIGSAAFMNCSGISGTLIIPNSVTFLSTNAFRNCTSINDLNIGTGLTAIESWAFSGCSGLVNVIIPNTVNTIGQSAFSGCSGLQELTLGSSITTIQGNAFWNCPALTTVHFNATNCTQMSGADTGGNHFSVFNSGNSNNGTSAITTLTIGNNVSNIPDYAFKNSTHIYNLSIPNSVISIGDGAFQNCTGISGSLSISNSVISIGDHAFQECIGLNGSLNIPNSVTSIGQYAFYGCSGIASVTIGTGVNSIGDWAFWNCPSLTTVHFNATNCTQMHSQQETYLYYSVFNSSTTTSTNPAITTLTIGNNVTNIPDYAFKDCLLVHNLSIPDGVISIGERAFWNCSGLNGSLSIPNSVTSIGQFAFYGCSGIASVTIGTGVTSIGGKAFWNCPSITTIHFNATNCTQMQTSDNSGYYSVFNSGTTTSTNPAITTLTIGNNVTRIPAYAFKNCTNITGIMNISNSVTSIGQYAFYGCSGIASLTIGESVNAIGGYSFWNCPSLTHVTINAINCVLMSTTSGNGSYSVFNSGTTTSTNPAITTITISNNVTRIPACAFKNCSGMVGSLSIPSSVTSIGDMAFMGCTGLTGSLIIPNTVTSIGAYAFQNCSGVTGLTIGTGVNYIGGNAFAMCSGITGSLNIPNSVTSIGYRAFVHCIGVNGQLTIGNSVNTISSMAFSECPNISSIHIFAETPPVLEGGCFSSNIYTKPIYVPCGTIELYQSANNWNAFTDYHATGCSYEITASANPVAGGTVSGGGSYQQGATCTLIATANIGFTFVNWTKNGTIVSTNSTYSFSVNENAAYTANFSINSFTIITEANPSIGGAVSGGGSFNYGSMATLTATANPGYTFINWTNDGNVVSTESTYSFTVTSSGTYVAHFSTNAYAITANANPSTGGSVSGFGNYTYGSTCTLMATANPGYTFVNWTKNGTVVSMNTTYSFSVTENATYIANFSLNNYSITVTANPAAGGTVTGSGTYNHGETVTLTANPNTCYTFVNWTKNGSVVSINTTYSFTATEAGSYVANFIPIYEITATANPVDGGTVTGGGSYNQGAYCSLIATSNPGYTFVNWTKNGTQISTNNTYTFTVTEASSYVANFVPLLEITTTSNPSTGGTTSGSGTYSYGSTCTITAIANTGYTFVNWTKNGSVVSTNSTYSFTVNETANYVANFNLNSYTITVTADPTIGGNTSGGGTYNHGESCTLIATANNDYNFINWTKDGTVVSANAEYTFTVTSGGNYVAHFSQNIYYTVVALANPEEGGTITGSGTFSQGEQCTLTASANTGYTFVNWTKNGNIVSTSTTYSFIVNETAEYIANFSTNSYSVTATANPVEGGYITGTGTYSYGATATLTAIANDGYTFESWMYDGMVISNSAYIITTVTDNFDFIANFSHNSYTINASVNPINSGVITGQGCYNYGETAILSVIPNANYVFTNWTENGSVISEEPSFSFTVTENRNFVANLIFVDGILETEFPNFTIYPNPATDNLYIDGTTNIRCCEIYTSNGRLVYKHSDNSNKIKVNVSNLSSGGYIVKIHFDNMICTKKIVIE